MLSALQGAMQIGALVPTQCALQGATQAAALATMQCTCMFTSGALASRSAFSARVSLLVRSLDRLQDAQR